LSGDVKLELSGEPMAQVYCHCEDCQAAHGAAFLKVAIYPVNAVKVTRGNPVSWKVVRTARVTCPHCGTHLYQEPPGFPVKGVNGYLLPTGMFAPTWHQQCQHSVGPVKDGLPHYKGNPAAIGGSDEMADW
jgi:hypothetical protein